MRPFLWAFGNYFEPWLFSQGFLRFGLAVYWGLLMKGNFDRSVDLVLVHEGGYVDHPKDPGGATNLGITRKTLAAFRGVRWLNLSKREVRNLGVDEAKKIYKVNYWDRALGDSLPAGLDYCVLDYGVNSGVSRAAKTLQRIVGAKVDGVIGLGTLRKVQEYGHPANIVNVMCGRRLSWLHRLKHWKSFGKGWKRRVDGVKEVAMKMTVDEFKAADRKNITIVEPKKLTIKEMAISLGVWGI